MTSALTTCFQATMRCLKCGQKNNVGFTQCDKHMNTGYKCPKVDKRTLGQRLCQKCLVPDPTQAFPNKQRASRARPKPSPGPGVLPESSSSQLSLIHGQPLQETPYVHDVPLEAAPYSATAGFSLPTPAGHMLPLYPPWGTAGTAPDAHILSTMPPYNMPNDGMLNDYNMASGIPAPTLAAGNAHSYAMYAGFECSGSVACTAPLSVSLTPDTSSPGSIMSPQPVSAYRETQPFQQG